MEFHSVFDIESKLHIAVSELPLRVGFQSTQKSALVYSFYQAQAECPKE